MQLIIPTINPGEQGTNVVNLQDALLALVKIGVFIIDAANAPSANEFNQLVEQMRTEQSKAFFGEATAQIIRYFQVQKGLGKELNGMVDENTAYRMNDLLSQMGIELSHAQLDEPSPQPNEVLGEDRFTVMGSVKDSNGNPQPDIIVSAKERIVQLIIPTMKLGDSSQTVTNLQAALLALLDKKIIHGNTPPNLPTEDDLKQLAEKLKEEQFQEVFGKATRELVLIFQLQNGLGDNFNGEVEEQTAKLLNAYLSQHGLLDGNANYQVSGYICDQALKPVTGLFVKAYDRDLSNEQPLGEQVKSDETGFYRIPYQQQDFVAAESITPAPDLQVKVFDQNGQLLATSPIKFNARTDETINFEISIESKDKVSEWAHLTQIISPLLKGQGKKIVNPIRVDAWIATDLLANELNAENIFFIEQKTGLSTTAIQAWITAYVMQQEAIAELTEHSTDYLPTLNENGWEFFYAYTSLNVAQSLNTLCKLPFEAQERAWKNALSAEKVSAIPDSQLKLLFAAISLLGKIKQLDPIASPENPFAQLLSVASPKMPRTLALQLMPLLEADQTDPINRILELRQDDNKADINRLVQGLRLQSIVGNHFGMMGSLLSELSDDTDGIDDLVKIPTAGFVDMAKQQNIGLSEAYGIQSKIELNNPLLAIQTRLDNAELRPNDLVTGKLKNVLQNEPEMVDTIFKGKTKVGKDAEDHLKLIKAVSNMLNLGVPLAVGNGLIENDFFNIAELGRKGKNILNFTPFRIDPKHHEIINNNIIGKVTQLVEIGNWFATDRPMRMPSWWLEKPPVPTPEQRENLPSLPGFFGDLDECLCRPCESMLGQPAYLVDLLLLLEKSTAAFNEFRLRRGDILDLPLTCENAETEVYHIDLALRILEKAIPNISLPQEYQLPSVDEALEPTYAPLSTSPYPWILPFDLKLTELRHYLSKLNINLPDLWNLSLVGNTISTEQKAAETLGLNTLSTNANASNDWNLIGLPLSGVNLWQAYGLSVKSGNVTLIDPASAEKIIDQPVLTVMRRISVLLDRTGLELDNFERVIATRFVKGTNSLSIEGRNQCKTSQMWLKTDSPSLENVLGRLHQFVRLYKRIGDWSIETLDALIHLVGGSLSPTTGSNARTPLLEIANIKGLSEKYHLPIELLLEVAEAPHSVKNLLNTLNLTRMQFALLKKLTAFDEMVSPFNFNLLKKLLETADALAELDVSIEMLSEAVLTNQTLQSINYVSETFTAAKTIEDFKTDLREVIKQADEKITSSSSTNEVISELSKILGSEDANKVVAAINQAGANKDNETDFIVAAEKTKNALKPLLQQARSFGEIKLNLADATINSIFTVQPANNANAEIRFGHLVKPIADILKEQALINSIASKFGISSQDSIALLTHRLPLSATQKAHDLLLTDTFFNKPPTQAENIQLEKWFSQLFRFTSFVKTVALDSLALTAIDTIKVGNSQFDWSALLDAATVDWQNDWQQLQDYFWLAQESHVGKDLLHSVLRETVFNNAIKPIAVRLDLSLSSITAMFELAGLTQLTQQDIPRPSLLRKAFEICLIAKKLGADAVQLGKLVNIGDIPLAVAVALELLQKKSTPTDWISQKQKHKDRIRKARRDALVAYHLELKNNTWADRIWKENDLYEHHLIDPMMQTCMKTTKVVEAIMATQLFAQRVLFGLEPNIMASDELKNYWPWMRNYRVWEANRKVFLFPENWLYPELRDDKSSSFKLLESTLGQGELNEESAKEAFGRFLDDVAQMGQVEVLGMYEDISLKSDGTVELVNDLPKYRVLYVIGRTLNPPYQYYWRSCADFGSRFMEWSPWQLIELDIQGDHVLPFVFRGKLHIAWPRIEKIKAEDSSKKDKWRITLAWTHFDYRNWSKISVSRPPIENDLLNVATFTDERSAFSLRAHIDENSNQKKAEIHVYAVSETPNSVDEIVPIPNPDPIGIVSPPELYNIDHTEELATLIKTDFFSNAFHSFPEKYRQMLEAYCTRSEVLLNKGKRVDLPGLVYPGLDVFGNKNAYSTHRNEVASWPHVAALVPSIGVQVSFLDRFVKDFLQYAYSRIKAHLFHDFVNDVVTQCHERKIHFRVWVKVNYNKIGFVKLPSTRGPYQIVMGADNLVVSGEDLKPITRMGKGANSKIKVYWVEKNQWSVEVPLAEIEIGKSANQYVDFVIDATKLDVSTWYLGLSQSMSHRLKFDIAGKQSVKPQLGTGTSLSLPLSNTEPWVNGFREISEQNVTLIISRTGGGDLALVGNSQSSHRYQITGASYTQGCTLPRVYHFSEGQSQCYIDVAAYSGENRVAILPSSGSAAINSIDKWFRQNELPIGFSQSDNGGFDELPPLINQTSNRFADVATGIRTFNSILPNACYNWEIFFHAPLMIADQLSKQQKFEEAEHWLRYIFDPTSTEPGTDAKRFLKFRVFKDLDTNQQVIDDLTALSQTASGYYTAADTKQVENLIKRWRERPFRPFVVARGRHIAFLWRTLFSYLDNLLAWADSLYRRDTRESINEALMLYALAMKILGRKPKKQIGKSKRKAIHFNEFIGQWDDFANFWIDVGAPHSNYVWANPKDIVSDKPRPTSVGMLAFCMPFNDKILNYWNVVEGRLFNIRHCRNIEGIERSLPLTDPPINPELLVRATAAGLDIGSVIAGLYASPPHYRYSTLANRATELANDVKALGGALLSALEKRDAEGLALLRGANEISLLKLVTDLRNLQISEAENNLEALRASRRSVATRYYQYQRLIGKKDIKVPIEGETAGEDSMLGTLDDGLASGRSGLGLIHEENEVYTGIKAANDWSTIANITKLAGSLFYFGEALAYANVLDGGEKTAKALKAFGQGTSLVGDGFSFVSQAWRAYADQQSMLAGHLRRRDEWAFQSNQTLKELQQIDKQILANQVRIEITKKELSNHIEQLEQAKAIDEVMRSKFTNQQLYEWMSRELSSLYDKTYRLALDTARKAERGAERELGTKPLNVIRHDYWDSMKQGLLAGERLYHDLKRLEVTYLEQNRREFELTKHISLKRLNPAELMKLRYHSDDDDGNKINKCEFEIPEWLFDLDTPGHYLRRIKSVSVSIPCVVGPYTSINCKLTLLKSSFRHDKTSTDYHRTDTNGVRFTDYYGASEAIVTSTASGDSGMFETQLRDERFLPFEGCGVVSTWRLELPADYPQFDYSTISDVILSIRYTARDGGIELTNAATDNISNRLSLTTDDKLLFPVLLSCKSDFPTQWAKANANLNEKLIIPITKNLIPYWMDAVKIGTGTNAKNLTVRLVMVADLPKGTDSKPTFVKVWPPSTPLVVPEWPESSLDSINGVGSGDTGSLSPSVADRFLLLWVGT